MRRDSACSVGVVLVKNGRIAQRYQRLIRPPRRAFAFTHIHGLTWQDVRDSPSFARIWPGLRALLDKADFLVAHNAPCDRGVLNACCRAAGVAPPKQEFFCSMRIARARWRDLPGLNLAVVCRHLQIPLEHHNALSDAEACATIVIKALR